MQDKEYNFQYLLNLYNEGIDTDYIGYEAHKIRNAIDNKVSNVQSSYVFHFVPICYSFALMSGLSTFMYMIISRV